MNNTYIYVIGISYQTHPQASLRNVAQFKDIVGIKTCGLPTEKKVKEKCNDFEQQNLNCNCQKIKTQIQISASNIEENLVITCSGVNVSYCNSNCNFERVFKLYISDC